MESITDFRPCGDCTACCSGQLMGESYGNWFGRGKKCIFLVKESCTIYETRPESCRKYQCAWSQHLLDMDLRPDKCGLMVSVEIADGRQYLKAIEIWPNVPYESYKRLNDCAKKLNTDWIKVNYTDEYNIYNQRGCR